MAYVITCTNQKGGVAKTTTNWALASAFRARGLRVLLVDLDPQCNLTGIVCGHGVELTIKDVFDRRCGIREAVVRDGVQTDIVPSTLALASSDATYTSIGREQMLARALRDLEGDYDYVLVDTPPALGVLTLNALTAADSVVIPMMVDEFSFQALRQLSETIRAVVEYANPRLRVAGICVTNYQGRGNYDKANLAVLRRSSERIGVPVFDTVVRSGVKVREAQGAHASLFEYAPRSTQAAQYDMLADEILEAIRHE